MQGMDDLDEIARRSTRLQDRFVSAVTFSAAAAAAAVFVPAERSFMLLVAAWAAALGGVRGDPAVGRSG